MYEEKRLKEVGWLRRALFLDGRRDVPSGMEWSGVECTVRECCPVTHISKDALRESYVCRLLMIEIHLVSWSRVEDDQMVLAQDYCRL